MERLSALLRSHSAAETIRIGRSIGGRLQPGDVLALIGSLGSGKTTFVKGLARGLGLRDDRKVKSPTFVLLHQYAAKCPLYHVDLFRLNDLAEVEQLGWDDLLGADGVVAVEWAEKIAGFLPRDYLQLEFKIVGQEDREILWRSFGRRYEALMEEVLRHR